MGRAVQDRGAEERTMKLKSDFLYRQYYFRIIIR